MLALQLTRDPGRGTLYLADEAKATVETVLFYLSLLERTAATQLIRTNRVFLLSVWAEPAVVLPVLLDT